MHNFPKEIFKWVRVAGLRSTLPLTSPFLSALRPCQHFLPQKEDYSLVRRILARREEEAASQGQVELRRALEARITRT